MRLLFLSMGEYHCPLLLMILTSYHYSDKPAVPVNSEKVDTFYYI